MKKQVRKRKNAGSVSDRRIGCRNREETEYVTDTGKSPDLLLRRKL